MKWLEDIERRCIMGEKQEDGEMLRLPPTPEQTEQLVAAVRLSESRLRQAAPRLEVAAFAAEARERYNDAKRHERVAKSCRRVLARLQSGELAKEKR